MNKTQKFKSKRETDISTSPSNWNESYCECMQNVQSEMLSEREMHGDVNILWDEGSTVEIGNVQDPNRGEVGEEDILSEGHTLVKCSQMGEHNLNAICAETWVHPQGERWTMYRGLALS